MVVKRLLKAIIGVFCKVSGLSPAEVVEAFLQAFTAVVVVTVGIKPFFTGIVFLARLLSFR